MQPNEFRYDTEDNEIIKIRVCRVTNHFHFSIFNIAFN